MEKELGNSRCSFIKITDSPGPGTYQVPSMIKEGPCITIKGRFKAKKVPLQPGPGQYDIPQEKVPSYVMGVSKREPPRPDSIKSDLPGPGTYTIPHEYLGSQCKFLKPAQFSGSKTSSNLGPGSYNFSTTLLNKSFFLAPRRSSSSGKLRQIVPGPGTYEPCPVKSNSSIHIGISKRAEIKDNNMPGPGTYTINSRPSTGSTSFGVGNRSEIKNNIECHNSYDLPSTIGEGPKISLRSRMQRKSQSLGPGPGTYFPESPQKIPTFLFGLSKREIWKNNNTSPGPIYCIEAPVEGPVWKFAGAPKQKIDKRAELPGPGSYENKSTLKKSRITFKSRMIDLSLKYAKTVPGPGTYDQEAKAYTPSWSLGKASRGLEWTNQEKAAIMKKGEPTEELNCSNPNLRKASSSRNLYKKK